MAARSTAVTPMLKGRLQTRLFVSGTVGVLWTAAVTTVATDTVRNGHRPGLPHDVREHRTHGVARPVLGTRLHIVQQTRLGQGLADLAGPAHGRNEAVVLWFVDHGLHVVPGTVGLSSPSWLRSPSMSALPGWPCGCSSRGRYVCCTFVGASRAAGSSSGARTAAGAHDWLDTRWFESYARRAPRTHRPSPRRATRATSWASGAAGHRPRSSRACCARTATSATPTPGTAPCVDRDLGGIRCPGAASAGGCAGPRRRQHPVLSEDLGLTEHDGGWRSSRWTRSPARRTWPRFGSWAGNP